MAFPISHKIPPQPAFHSPLRAGMDYAAGRKPATSSILNPARFSTCCGRSRRKPGNYDIDLTWTPDEQQGTIDAGPTLFTAIEEQLGLKLVPAKASVDVLVIDHVERPTEN